MSTKAQALGSLLSKEPVDPFDHGDVIRWNRTFRSGKTYTYAVIKTNEGLWFVTGKTTDPTGKTTDPFDFLTLVKEYLVHADRGSIKIAQSFEPVEF